MFRLKVFTFAAFLIFSLFVSQGWARTVEYRLTIALQEVNLTGKPVQAMAINGNIPGPTLRFREGDMARIHVQNSMDVDTSIHWHGMLVPPLMDGVPFVSFPPIAPGATFTYEFPIRQSGTYWYHSHTELQEQRGLYGSIVIDPREGGLKPDRDYVVLFSDWTNEDPHEVLRTLKRGSEWYSIRKGSAQSILGAARLGMLGDYVMRELQRMPPMDISDVAYDLFLANGKPETTLRAEPGETIRVRIVDGSATTYFNLEFAGGPMTIIAADGPDVEPIEITRFLIGVAETYDVIFKMPKQGAYELRATAHDGSGHASVWIGSGERHLAPDVPLPNLYHLMDHQSPKRIFALTPQDVMGMSDREVESGKFDQPGMMGMHAMKMDNIHDMDQGSDTSGMKMVPKNQAQPMKEDAPGSTMVMSDGEEAASTMVQKTDKEGRIIAVDGMDPSRPWPPYAKLRATKSTALSKDKPVREIRLTLDGDMERYVWFLNKKPLSESDSIQIHKGEIVRFIMINRTMMHHPMHLHGHFFRVIQGQGDQAPLKHTVDVAPMSTTVIEFDANEVGDWFFHCHLLYHMKSGMARVVHYKDYALTPQLNDVRPNLYKDPWYFWGLADLMSNMTQGFLMASNTRNMLAAAWEIGWQDVEDTEWEGIFTWGRYINRFFTVFAGADVVGVHDDIDDARGVLGLRYLIPLNFESRLWIDSDAEFRINLEKHFNLTPRFSVYGEVEYDTLDDWEGRVGLSYVIGKSFSIVGQWHSDYGFGGGLRIRF